MGNASGFDRSYASGTMADFKLRVADNMRRLAKETGDTEFAVPLALVLAIDAATGGDVNAQEIIRRFALIDVESRNIIDFFFLGWSKDAVGAVTFSLPAFAQVREALREVGVTRFGGNASLYVLDAWWHNGRVTLDFENAIYIDLTVTQKKGNVLSIGEFLQGLIDAAEAVRTEAAGGSAVLRISDRLGLASAKASFLDYLLNKWGEMIGANKLADVVTRRIGPKVDLAQV
jgi:hypothetical protein